MLSFCYVYDDVVPIGHWLYQQGHFCSVGMLLLLN